MNEEFSPELQSLLEEEGIVETQPKATQATAQSTEAEAPADMVMQVSSPQSEQFDLGKAAADVAIGIPEGASVGIVNSLGETAEGLYGIADWTGNRFGGDLPDFEYNTIHSDTQTGRVIEPVAQFVTGFVGAGKFLKLAGWAGKGKKVFDSTRAIVQGGLADFFSFDAHEARLSNLINEVPFLKNPITEYLAADPNDREIEGRFKSMIEGFGLGKLTDGLLVSLKQLKGIRLLRTEKGSEEAAKVIANNADAFDEGLDALYPPKVTTEVKGRIVNDSVNPELDPLDSVISEGASSTPVTTPVKPIIDEKKATDYAKEVNRILEEGGDPTKLNLALYVDSEVFKDANQIEDLFNTLVQSVRDNDKIISHEMSIEEAEKMFSTSISSLADLMDVSKESLTQTLLRDAKSIKEAGIRSVMVANVLSAIQQEAFRIAPLVKRMDDEAAQHMRQLQEAAYRIVPADALVGTELGRCLNLRQVRASFTKDAASIIQNQNLDPLELANALQSAKNSYARQKLMQMTLDTITRVRINAMLSGVATQAVNMTSNLIKTAITPGEYVLGGMAMKALGKQGGAEAMRQGVSLYRGLWSAFSDSWRMTGSAIRQRKGVFRDGKLSQLDVFEDLTKFENVLSSPDDALKYVTINDLKGSSARIMEALDEGDFGKLTSMVWSTGLRTLGAVLDVPSTLLNGADEFFLNLNGRAMMYSQLTEQGLAKGHTPGSPELSQFIEENFQKYFKQNGALLREDAVGKKAFAFATDSNFSSEMTEDTIFGKVGLGLKQAQSGEGGYSFIMQNIAPFVRTPVKLLEDTVNHVPGVNAILNQQVRDDLASGGLRQARRIGEMVTGSMFLATAGTLVSQGLITGSGPTNPQLREQLKKTGWKPYSIKIPDQNLPDGFQFVELARFEPYSSYFTVLADFMEAKQADDRHDYQEFYSKLVASVTNNLTSKKYLTGLIDTMDLMSGLAYGDLEQTEKFFNNFAGSFVPSIAKNVREIQDPLYRDARNMADTLRNRTPFLSQNVPVQYDFRGKPSLTPVLSIFARPDMDEVDVEIMKLSQMGGIVDTISSRDRRFLSQYRNKNGKTAYERLGELMGQVGKDYYSFEFEGKTLTQALKEAIKSKDYTGAADPFTTPDDVNGSGGKVAILRNFIASYREAAEERLRIEGFYNQDGRHFMAVEQEKKDAQQVETKADYQQFIQNRLEGTTDIEVQDYLNNADN